MRIRGFSLALGLALAPLAGAADQPVYGGEITAQAERRTVALSVESESASARRLARRAFALHGGFRVVPAAEAALRARFAREGDAVRLVVGAGEPLQKQLDRRVSGDDARDAILRACDLVVNGVYGTPGFFAGELAFVGKQRGASEIYVSDLLFDQVRQVTSDKALVLGPEWAPEGDRLLYTSYHASGFPDIFQIDFSSGRRRGFATFEGTNTGASFSPDGSRVAMVLSGTGNAELFVADREGGSIQRLTDNSSLEASPSWSPEGRRLVFTSDAPGEPRLFEIGARGGPMRVLPTDISGYTAEPHWNPVRERLIAFTAAMGRGFQIALYDRQKEKSEFVTSGPGDAMEPCWLSDGRHLVYTRERDGGKRLMLLDTETGESQALHSPSFGQAYQADFVYP